MTTSTSSHKLTGLLAKMWQGHREVGPGSMEGRRGRRSHRLRGAAWEGTEKRGP